LFNPTNFGIIVMVASGLAWITPGQWGQGEAGAAMIFLAAVGILWRVKRWDLSLTFLVVLATLEFAYSVWYLGWEVDVFWHGMSNGTILLFAFFMITDPKTSPDSRKGRIGWGVLIAGLSFILARSFYLYEAPLIALFIISVTTPLMDKIFRANRFQWIPKTLES
jgi:Na+-translocating ferredoxin:NAD+ oxidoreductase RnfD subunit